jgi:hypothetical protein
MNYKGNIEPQQTYFSKALSRREKHCFSMVDHLPVVFHSPVQQKKVPSHKRSSSYLKTDPIKWQVKDFPVDKLFTPLYPFFFTFFRMFPLSNGAISNKNNRNRLLECLNNLFRF